MDIDIETYFNGIKGKGILATADGQGRVDGAIYARPHVFDGRTVAFIMADRLTHHNLQSNGHAAYMFIEEGADYRGVRLFLKKIREEQDDEKINAIRRRKHASNPDDDAPRFLVSFNVEKVLPLTGSGEGKKS